MKNGFYAETKDIYRLRVPFEDLYTSVFLVKTATGAILVDCATTAKDVDGQILPALDAMGLSLTDVDTLILTHKHGDHAGGLARVLELAPHIEVVRDVRALSNGLVTYPLAGHTTDCIGLVDTRSDTLISGDGLQGEGVGKYRCYTQDPVAYLDTLKRIGEDERIKQILFSHAYEPWNQDRIIGRDNVNACLAECTKYVKGETK